MGNAVVAKGKSFRSVKHFPLRSKENSFAEGFSIHCLKEKYLYKIIKDFLLTSTADSHNSVLQYYTFLAAVVKCSTKVPLKRGCEVLEYLAALSPQYISINAERTTV